MKDFSPINPHGRPAANRHARRAAMATQPLYQVHVDTAEGARIAVGPAAQKDVAERLCMAIGIEIAAGREKSWSDPSVERARIIH